MKMYHDTNVIINISNNPVLHDKLEHIKIGRHFIREKIDSKELIFTKELSTVEFENNVGKLDMLNTYAQLDEEH